MFYTLFFLPIFAAVETAGQPLIERLVGEEAAELSVEVEPVVEEEERRRQWGITSRLVNRGGFHTSANSGLLQMLVGRIWKYVCDDFSNRNNNGPNVACREMGYTSGRREMGYINNHRNFRFVHDVQCTGRETFLGDCRRASGESCSAGEAVFITCSGSGPKARLVNSRGVPVSQGSTRGILQMKVGTSWKYVCDDAFDRNNHGPNVACRELGFTPVAPNLNPNAMGYYATQRNARAPNNVNFVDDVVCNGRETSLTQCAKRRNGENCFAGEAVLIHCLRSHPSGCSATFYQGRIGEGENWTLRETGNFHTGRWILGHSAWRPTGFKNNDISSFIVKGPGCQLIVADTFVGGRGTGTTQTFGLGPHWLTGPRVIQGTRIGNNRISAVRLVRSAPTPPPTRPPTPPPTPPPTHTPGQGTYGTACEQARGERLQFLDRFEDLSCPTGEVMNAFHFSEHGCTSPQMKFGFQCLTVRNAGATSVHHTGCNPIVNENLHFLDRHPVTCPAGKFLTSWRMMNHQCPTHPNWHQRIRFTCIAQPGMHEAQAVTRQTACNQMRGQHLQFLDRHRPNCGAGYGMKSWKLWQGQCTGDDMRIQYICVPLTTPTDTPTNAPTNRPTDTPTHAPTNRPTDTPTYAPTNRPTDTPTHAPTDAPTTSSTPSPPTNRPTDTPTHAPTHAPTDTPTTPPTPSQTTSHTPGSIDLTSGCTATLYQDDITNQWGEGENWTLRETGRWINGGSSWTSTGFQTNDISSVIVSGTGCSLIVADGEKGDGDGTTHTFKEGRHAHAYMLTSPIGNDRISSVRLVLTMNSRLVNSSGQKVHGLSGILQMKDFGNTWKYVCDHWFANNNNGPTVACREMGFSGGTQADASAPNADNFYDDIRCTGSETSLADCEMRKGENCSAGDAVFLTCSAAVSG